MRRQPRMPNFMVLIICLMMAFEDLFEITEAWCLHADFSRLSAVEIGVGNCDKVLQIQGDNNADNPASPVSLRPLAPTLPAPP